MRRIAFVRYLPGTTSVLTCLLLLGIVVRSLAETVPMGVEDLAHEAGWVVEGTVDDLDSAWSPDGTQIYTFVTIGVRTLLKGTHDVLSDTNHRRAALRLRLLGGVVGDVAMIVPEGPAFEHGQQVVVFVAENPRAFFPVVGMSQGVFVVSTDTQSGREVLSNPEGVSLERREFEDRVRRGLGR